MLPCSQDYWILKKTNIPADIKMRCKELIPNPLDVDVKHSVDAFLYSTWGKDLIQIKFWMIYCMKYFC